MRGLCLMAIKNCCQANDIRAAFKVTKWRVFYHPKTPQSRPARFKQV